MGNVAKGLSFDARCASVRHVGQGKRTVITFLTGHYYLSPRRAGFHNLADAAYRAGMDVNFVTVGYSLISYLRRDYRTRLSGIRENFNKIVEIKPGFSSYIHFTLWHPHTFLVPFLNRITKFYVDRYGEGNLGGLLPLARKADIFVFESMSALFLFNRFQKENPVAKTVYRVSDDLRILGSTHPRLLEVEQQIAPLFDCVSVPASIMLDIFPNMPSLRLDRHGLDKAAYDVCTVSPYPRDSHNAVFVGTGYMDTDFIRYAARGNPECNFHIIGPMPNTINLLNVLFYGEMPFTETVPYIKFADVGLLNLAYKNSSSSSYSDSLKTIQYRYCGLPIVAPDFLDLNRDGVFYYAPGDEKSCEESVRQALSSERDMARAEEVRSWGEVFADIINACNYKPVKTPPLAVRP